MRIVTLPIVTLALYSDHDWPVSCIQSAHRFDHVYSAYLGYSDPVSPGLLQGHCTVEHAYSDPAYSAYLGLV